MPRHPYAASVRELVRALAPLGIPFLVEPKGERCQVWLPSAGDQPLPSWSGADDAGPPAANLQLGLWAVDTLVLDLSTAVNFLAEVAHRRPLSRSLAVGQDLLFWARALQLAAALVAQGHYVPDLMLSPSGPRAVWRPVWLGGQRDLLLQLAEAMPGACRALGDGGMPEGPPPALAVLEAFIAAVVDRLVRDAADQAGLVPLVEWMEETGGRGDAWPASLHDRWLDALVDPEGYLLPWEDVEEQLKPFAAQLHLWQQRAQGVISGSFRLCLRLEEPGTDEDEAGEEPVAAGASGGGAARAGGDADPADTWRVRYLLQAPDDPSLLVPAEAVWQPGPSEKALQRRYGVDLRNALLASLGQAASICPQVAASLQAPAPTGFTLDTHGAYRFLTETAPALKEAGVGVLLPAWWTQDGARARLKARARVVDPGWAREPSGLGLEEILQVDWEVALGDQALSLRELRALANLKTPLVKVRGRWVQLDPEEIRAALNLWQKRRQGMTMRELVQIGLGGARREAEGLPVELEAPGGPLGELLARLQGREALELLPPPAGFAGALRPYQVRGYSWLAFLTRWGLGACLADDMGLGKTAQTLALLQHLWENGRRRPSLLVCPTSVMGNWAREAARFTPQLPVLVHHGGARASGEAFLQEAHRHALVITSYGLLVRDLALLQGVAWQGVILDEAQNIKNPETKQARAARSLTADFRVALTGTPVENHVGELWSIFHFLNPGLLGSKADFQRRYAVPIQIHRDEAAARRLKRVSGPFILRRLKTDPAIVADLPEKLEMKVYCPLTREQASLYAAVVAEAERALREATGIQRRGLVLATLTKLKQICNHPAHFLGDGSALAGRSGKLARLTEMADELLAAGDRALIFTQFTEMGEMLQRYLQEVLDCPVLFLHGGVPAQARDAMVARFQEDDGPPLFILSLRAGGTGLNLTRASHVFHFDRWWNPAVENQATDRAFRLGQTKNVQVHKLICQGTLEERIDELIERKQSLAQQVVGTGEEWLTELSTDELRELLALRPEAVVD